MYGQIYESLQAEKLLRRDEYFSGTENLSINKTFKGNYDENVKINPLFHIEVS